MTRYQASVPHRLTDEDVAVVKRAVGLVNIAWTALPRFLVEENLMSEPPRVLQAVAIELQRRRSIAEVRDLLSRN